jgi:hypothetical protein
MTKIPDLGIAWTLYITKLLREYAFILISEFKLARWILWKINIIKTTKWNVPYNLNIIHNITFINYSLPVKHVYFKEEVTKQFYTCNTALPSKILGGSGCYRFLISRLNYGASLVKVAAAHAFRVTINTEIRIDKTAHYNIKWENAVKRLKPKLGLTVSIDRVRITKKTQHISVKKTNWLRGLRNNFCLLYGSHKTRKKICG